MRSGAVRLAGAAGALLVGTGFALAAWMPPAATFEPVFEPCAHCHQIGRDARTTTGPALTGVIGRRAGQVPGYPFSDAMRASGLVWDRDTLARYIASPQAVVPGTRMVFAGLDDPAQIRALVDFIEAQGRAAH